MTEPATDELITQLEKRTIRRLPNNWQASRNCPECGVGANRPKCMWEMGPSCPRHDPDNYDPSPFIEVPDPNIQALIARIRQAEADNAKLKQERSDMERTMLRMRAEAADLRETIANRTRERDAALARIKVMDEALKPFANRLTAWESASAEFGQDFSIIIKDHAERMVPVGWIRAARAARKEPTDG